MTTPRITRPANCKGGCGNPAAPGRGYCAKCRSAQGVAGRVRRKAMAAERPDAPAPLAPFLVDPSLLPKRPPGR